MLQVQIGDVGIVVLAPENVRRLQAGDPIRIRLELFTDIRALAIDYTTDTEWLAKEMKAHVDKGGDPRDIYKLIAESAKRPEPPVRGKHPPLFYVGGPQTGGHS